MTRYVIVSPVKNEERNIERTLRSVCEQTLLPGRWIVVDDSSTDRTAALAQDYAQRNQFITVIRKPATSETRLGSRVVDAFNVGWRRLDANSYDFIVKLDCDLSFDPDYFRRLLAEFASNPRLGIASGVYLELDRRQQWQRVEMPDYHAFGACKVVRRQCFEDIGGFVSLPGWDTVDEIRARTRGWHTQHFGCLEVKHHKPEGSRAGVWKTNRMHGQIFFTTGGGPLLLMAKAARRATAAPYLLGAAALTYGYCAAAVSRMPRLVDRTEARYYRRLLRARFIPSLRRSDRREGNAVTAA
jgi:glycosyltransferase involved in cell wall biosynthesis